MPRLKTHFARWGLPSLKLRKKAYSRHINRESAPAQTDRFTAARADYYCSDRSLEARIHSDTVDALTEALSRLRSTLCDIAEEAPVVTEAKAAPVHETTIFDRDLFDGEPLYTGRGTGEITGLDADLFEEITPATPRVRRSPATIFSQPAA